MEFLASADKVFVQQHHSRHNARQVRRFRPARPASGANLLGGAMPLGPLVVRIETRHQTGRDMYEKYKETSLGGLAVNVPNC